MVESNFSRNVHLAPYPTPVALAHDAKPLPACRRRAQQQVPTVVPRDVRAFFIFSVFHF
jgi:hypothetical protein